MISSPSKISPHTKKFLKDISSITHLASKLTTTSPKASPPDFTKINHTILSTCRKLDFDMELHSNSPHCPHCSKIIHELKSSLSIISILAELMTKNPHPPNSSTILSLTTEINRTQKLISQAKDLL